MCECDTGGIASCTSVSVHMCLGYHPTRYVALGGQHLETKWGIYMFWLDLKKLNALSCTGTLGGTGIKPCEPLSLVEAMLLSS